MSALRSSCETKLHRFHFRASTWSRILADGDRWQGINRDPLNRRGRHCRHRCGRAWGSVLVDPDLAANGPVASQHRRGDTAAGHTPSIALLLNRSSVTRLLSTRLTSSPFPTATTAVHRVDLGE